MIALLIQWRRSDRRTATRLDRAADRDDDAELAAYNAMLAQMAQRRQRRAALDRARGDRRGPAAVPLMSVPVAAGAVAAERGSPCAVVEFDLAELHRCGQGGEEPAERRGGEQPRCPISAAPGSPSG